MARYWSQDAENYGNIIEGELSSFRVGAWQRLLKEKMPAGAKKILDLATNEVEGVRFQLPKDKGGDKGLPREQKFLVKPSIIVFAVVLELPDINQMAVYDFVGTLQELAFGDSADAHRYTGEHTNCEGGYGYQYGNLLLLSNRKFALYGKGIAGAATGGGASVYPGGVGRR